MKEFINKLIGRLKELQKLNYEAYETAQWNNDKIMYINASNAYANAITEVNELAEEYNNGWIPCSERLPKKSGKYLITQERYSLEDRLCKRPIAIEVDYVVFNATDNLWARASFFKVIAWQPLPAPYKEGVTENE